jgi:putative PIN family toxin of toxin-antitoxin system
MKSKSAYVVIDTNVLISAGLLSSSKSAQVLALAVEHFVIAQNDQTWQELETRIARAKFDRYFGPMGRMRHLVQIAQSAEFFQVAADVNVSRDKTDDKFIGLAIDSGAKIVISVDPDLKVISIYKNVEILSPTQFFERFN